MKPLYLQGSCPLKVTLDGPALRIAQDGVADSRFPLARVSRVIVSGNVSWTTDALLACADEGIFISFLSAAGSTRARWIGRCSKRSAFSQRWIDFVDRPDWEELYHQWSVASRRRAVRLCALRMGWSPQQDTGKLISAIIGPLHQRLGHEYRALVRHMRGLARTRALAELTHLGLGADDDALARISPELTAAIQWGLHPELSRWIRQESRKPLSHCKGLLMTNPRQMARFFEQNIGTVDFCLRDALKFLHSHLGALP